jgi:transcriptional regulatory protein RtcR
MKKRVCVLGFIGSKLDRPRKPRERWSDWRPTVAICQHEDFVVDRFELLFQPQELELQRQICNDIATASPETTVTPHEIAIADPWDFEEVYGKLHDFSRSFVFDLEQYDYLVHITTGTHVQQICLFLLTETRHLPARLLQTSPGKRRDQPRGTYRAIDLDLSRFDAIATRFHLEQKESLSYLKSGIETRDAKFNALIQQIERVAIASRAPLLITGPTGAGKSQLARRIYELKRQRKLVTGSFVEVNCATLRGDAAMSSLFGHVKGAYTGATSDRQGLLKRADQGMLFLDEIGELGLDEQAMLLRAIEEKVFQPVGADVESASDFQLLAGSNRDLSVEVQQGRFREDLLARINLWRFTLPGLASRRADIEPNLDYELEQYAARTGHRVTINREARDAFLQFASSADAIWQANFRDLNAAVTRMATLSDNGRIGLDAVRDEIDRLRSDWKTGKRTRTENQFSVHLPSVPLDDFDRQQLLYVLQVCHESNSLSDAGRKLFGVTRLKKQKPNDADRLKKYLARFGLDWQQLSH